MARKLIDSGIEWIGTVPADWKMSRLLWCLEEIKEKNNPIKTTNVLSLTNKLGVIPYEQKGNQGNKAKEDYSQYGLAFENTLVINSMNVLIGSVGISKYYGCVSPVYYVFKNTEKADLRLINYIFQNTGFQKELRKYANGILEIRMRISSHDMLRRIIPLPPLHEQIRISNYLDEECKRIDSVIEKTGASIEEYKKLKQAVITQAVTKGIRPNRPMKDSGIEWLGDIPKKWTIQKTKTIADRIVVGVVIKPADYFDENGTVPFLRGINVKEYLIQPEPMVYINEKTNELLNKSIVHKNDLLIVRDGSIGTTCVVPSEYDGANVVSMIIVTCKRNVSPQYMCYSFNSEVGQIQFDLTKIGTALTHTSVHSVSNIFHVLPPYDEQLEIVNYLSEKIQEIDSLINKKSLLLLQMELYKKSLIYEYVTGKREVPA